MFLTFIFLEMILLVHQIDFHLISKVEGSRLIDLQMRRHLTGISLCNFGFLSNQIQIILCRNPYRTTNIISARKTLVCFLTVDLLKSFCVTVLFVNQDSGF